MGKYTAAQKLRQFAKLGLLGTASFSVIAFYRGEPKFYSNVIMPLSQRLIDAENAHKLAIWAGRHNLLFSKRIKVEDDQILATKVFNMSFKNPIGLAAGFDKDAEAINGLAKVGFGFVEVGSITPKPQPGNPQPRVFRLKEDSAVINRYGFNSGGHEAACTNLALATATTAEKKTEVILGINLGKNKTSEDAVGDYVQGVKVLGPFADYLVINVSSPNTPGLRKLQGKKELEAVISKTIEARNQSLPDKKPILLKIAPDLNEQDKIDICDVILNNPKCQIDGLIVSNTTVSRPDSLKSALKSETGGLSGKPLKSLATQTITDMFRLTKGTVPIIGVGGVSSGADAYEKIRSGACLVQIYSAFAYQGPPVVYTIASELAELLRKDGFKSVHDAVGVDHKFNQDLM